jgi:vancomycin resistance protein YoaR
MAGYPANAPYRQPPPGMNPWLVRLPILLITGSILLVAALAALIFAFRFEFNGKITPGVNVMGVNLSGMSPAAAERTLADHFKYSDQAVFTFRFGEKFWQYKAAELGVSFDAQATANDAFAPGHTGSIASDLATQASVWLNGRSIAPIVRFDQQAAAGKLAAIAQQINRPPVNAQLMINGTTVSATPSQNGLTLDTQTALEQLAESVLRLDTGREITLAVNQTPPVIADAEAAAVKVRAALSGPVTLVADNPKGGTLGPWTANVDQIRAVLALTLKPNPDGSQSYDVDVNTEAFRGFLDTLAPGLITLPEDGRFHFNKDTSQLEPIKAAANGRTLDINGTLTRLREGIFTPNNRIVPLAFNYALPKFSSNTTAKELGITEIVAEATTYYAGSTQARKSNIIQAAAQFDGLIIAPGEEFSFNKYLGDISPETGFVQGKIIFGGRTIDGVGGGVCQVSTTAFRAALKAGFPITERNSHGYRVGFYEQNGSPPGLDAAIFQPTADFRFVNDTPYHLLIETTIPFGTDSLQFRFYSTNPGRQVIMEGPVIRDVVPALTTVYQQNAEIPLGQYKYVDWAAEGADVTFTRKILDGTGKLVRTDTIYTHYLPWAAVVQVAPGDSRLGT